MIHKGILLMAVLAILSSCNPSEKEGQIKRPDGAGAEYYIVLSGSWEFRQAGDPAWLPASVPGSVHTALLANGKIEDPFYRLNEHDLQWIDKTDWEYRTTFYADTMLTRHEKAEIHFAGLDTHADVYLNGQLILMADNMFREWTIDIKKYLQAGENSLRIYFHSPIKIGLEKLAATDYALPDPPNDLSVIGGLDDKKVSVFIRKAPYHFGWDWGPRLVTSGIWKDITIRGWDRARIGNLFIRQAGISEEEAGLVVSMDVESTDEWIAGIGCFVNGEKAFRGRVKLKPGLNRISRQITIRNPELWWPNGLGDQPLYDVNVVLKKGRSVISGAGTRIGLRDIKVIREPDAAGESFYFRVNGYPVFMKGANYIPQDVFLDRVTPERYEHIIQSAADANMNMLRVWGGGIYEKDIFYDLCDEKGILVWQDFMFACAMYPGDSAFLESVRLEAIDNVVRLRNHPCIALWCGNNENLSAWYNWGWKANVTREQGEEVADRIWEAYESKFHRILPGVVEEYDPGRFYWSSSPSAGEGIPENYLAGDAHYWGVWWGQEPFVNYRTKTCRFMSEYGFQSFPELNTVQKFAVEEDWDIYSEVMRSHQRSSIGNGTIENYMLQSYRKPKDFPMFLYAGQVLQAEGIRTAMEAHRTNMPYCMGSLFWQIDDCWPVASWSSIDYYGNWKAQQYFAKKAFMDILVSPQISNDTISIYIVSDRLEGTTASLVLRLMDFEWNILKGISEQVMLDPNSSKVCFSEALEAFTAFPVGAGRVLLHCALEIDGRLYADNILFFKPVKDLDLPVPGLKWELSGEGSRIILEIGTGKLAKNVYLSVPGKEVVFGDNWFDLLPGEKKKIVVEPVAGLSVDYIREHLRVISLVDSYSR